MPREFHTELYGLRLCSNRRLPGLIPASVNGPADLELEVIEGPSARVPDVAAVEWRPEPIVESGEPSSHRVWSGKSPHGVFLRLWYGISTGPAIEFVIDPPGRRVWACRQRAAGRPDPPPIEDVTTLFVGAVLGCVLRLRGTLCLHASVVAVGARAVVILGSKGAGKSTLAAALAGRGHPILSDDVAAVTQRDGRWLVQPGYPRLRLWPAALEALRRPVDGLATVLTSLDKRYLELAPHADVARWRFQSTPLPLSVIYLLTRDARLGAPMIEPVADSARLEKLVPYTYVSFLPLGPATRAQEFRRLFHLAGSMPVHHILCPEGLEHLPVLADTVLGHAAPIGQEQ